MDLENAKAQMRKGVLEMCILAIAAEAEVYPSDIIGRMKDNNLLVVEGTLYPMLTRLKNDGLLEYTWRESTTGPPRKYFKITAVGRQFLDGLTMSWQQLVDAVGQTLQKNQNGETDHTHYQPPPIPIKPDPELEPDPGDLFK